jgi:uncharacterized protein YcbK (DUF882 family)
MEVDIITNSPKDYFSSVGDLSRLQCQCCKVNKMKISTMDRLNRLRHKTGIPLIVTSGYRCPKHNEEVSATGRTGPHTTGHAVDLLVFGDRAYIILKYAALFGFTGIGLDQKGTHKERFIHLDDIDGDDNFIRPWLWTY